MNPKSVQHADQSSNEHSRQREDNLLEEDMLKLMQTDLSHRSQIRESLRYQLIESTIKHGGQTPMLSNRTKSLATLLIMVIALMFAMPTITAFAQSILAEVGLITVTDEQEHFEEPKGFDPAEPTASPLPSNWNDSYQIYETGTALVHANISLSQATEITGFDIIREPSYMPDGYHNASRSAILDTGLTSVATSYNKEFVANTPLDHIGITQARGSLESTLRVGSQAQVFDVIVNGEPATYISQANMYSSDGRLFNILLWEENDYTFMIVSPSIGQAELITIADSMYP